MKVRFRAAIVISSFAERECEFCWQGEGGERYFEKIRTLRVIEAWSTYGDAFGFVDSGQGAFVCGLRQ